MVYSLCQCDEMSCGATVELALRILLDYQDTISLFSHLHLGLKTNLYDNCQKDLEISCGLLTPFLFRPFHFLKCTNMMKRVLDIIAK